jgi:hypothetical protein
MGTTGPDGQWKIRISGMDFNFSRGLAIKGIGGVDHPVMLELTATFNEQAVNYYPGKRPRVLHLFYCTEVPAGFKERAESARFFQGPVPDPPPRWTPGARGPQPHLTTRGQVNPATHAHHPSECRDVREVSAHGRCVAAPVA